MKTCLDQRCTSSSRSAGISWSVKSLDSKATLLPSSVTRILVSKRTTYLMLTNLSIAGLTVGDPIALTGKPLSVELGPGK